jgi:hypothetical protein
LITECSPPITGYRVPQDSPKHQWHWTSAAFLTAPVPILTRVDPCAFSLLTCRCSCWNWQSKGPCKKNVSTVLVLSSRTSDPPPPLPTAFLSFSLHTFRGRLEVGNASIRVPLLPPAQGVTHPSLWAVFWTSRANSRAATLERGMAASPRLNSGSRDDRPRRHRGDSPYSARAWQRHRPPHLRDCLKSWASTSQGTAGPRPHPRHDSPYSVNGSS